MRCVEGVNFSIVKRGFAFSKDKFGSILGVGALVSTIFGNFTSQKCMSDNGRQLSKRELTQTSVHVKYL